MSDILKAIADVGGLVPCPECEAQGFTRTRTDGGWLRVEACIACQGGGMCTPEELAEYRAEYYQTPATASVEGPQHGDSADADAKSDSRAVAGPMCRCGQPATSRVWTRQHGHIDVCASCAMGV